MEMGYVKILHIVISPYYHFLLYLTLNIQHTKSHVLHTMSHIMHIYIAMLHILQSFRSRCRPTAGLHRVNGLTQGTSDRCGQLGQCQDTAASGTSI